MENKENKTGITKTTIGGEVENFSSCLCSVPLGENKCAKPLSPISEMKINFEDGVSEEEMTALMQHETLILKGNKLYDKDMNLLKNGVKSVETKSNSGTIIIEECNPIVTEIKFSQLKTGDND